MQGVNEDFIEHSDDFISIYHNVFPKSNCDQIIKKFDFLENACMHNDEVKRLHQEWEEIGHNMNAMDGEKQFNNGRGGRMDRAYNLIHIDDYCTSTSYDPAIRDEGCICSVTLVSEYLYNAIDDYMNHYGTLRKRHVYSNFNKVQKTPPGGGYHVWHDELGESVQHSDRTLVWMLYLNDDFEGGETEFLYQKKRVQPSPGTIVIWPAQWTHQHKGNMVLKGYKYIVTGWIHTMWTDHNIAGTLIAPDAPPENSVMI